MARIWANRLEAGTQVWASCPASRHEDVKAIMRQDVADGKNGMTAEKYYEICGEVYTAPVSN